jgi:hypothetical protein
MKLLNSKIPFHLEPCKDFLIRFLIENPNTKDDCPSLIKAFNIDFKNKDLDVELAQLYTLGIASRFAMLQFYICDSIQSLIHDCIKTNRTPIWD